MENQLDYLYRFLEAGRDGYQGLDGGLKWSPGLVQEVECGAGEPYQLYVVGGSEPNFGPLCFSQDGIGIVI